MGATIPMEPEVGDANPRVRLIVEAARLEEEEAVKAVDNPSMVRPALKVCRVGIGSG